MRDAIASPISPSTLLDGSLETKVRLRRRLGMCLMVGSILMLATISYSAVAKAGEAGLAGAGATGALAERSPAGADKGAALGASLKAMRVVETMMEGSGVRAPYGYERFCNQDPRYCAPPAKRRPGAVVTATRDLIDQLTAFNRSVNAEFTPAEDIEIYGASDHWTFPSVYADCEDYVLIKQRRLLKAGWPRESLLIGVVVGETSPFHAVLIVRTSKGEFVLDNMTDELRDWRDSGYKWVIRQSTERPERWVRVVPNAKRVQQGG